MEKNPFYLVDRDDARAMAKAKAKSWRTLTYLILSAAGAICLYLLGAFDPFLHIRGS